MITVESQTSLHINTYQHNFRRMNCTGRDINFMCDISKNIRALANDNNLSALTTYRINNVKQTKIPAEEAHNRCTMFKAKEEVKKKKKEGKNRCHHCYRARSKQR